MFFRIHSLNSSLICLNTHITVNVIFCLSSFELFFRTTYVVYIPYIYIWNDIYNIYGYAIFKYLIKIGVNIKTRAGGWISCLMTKVEYHVIRQSKNFYLTLEKICLKFIWFVWFLSGLYSYFATLVSVLYKSWNPDVFRCIR